MKKLILVPFALLLLGLILPLELPAVQLGDKLVSFSGKTMAGEKIKLDQVIGKKAVLLFFWASW